MTVMIAEMTHLAPNVVIDGGLEVSQTASVQVYSKSTLTRLILAAPNAQS